MNFRTIIAACVALLSLTILVRAADGVWISDAHTGCKLWDPEPGAHETVTWSGPCKSNLADGPGEVQWSTNGTPGEHCQANYVEGRLNGHAVCTFRNGDTYDGDWQNDQRSGHGVYVYAAGGRYDGEWQNDVRQGRGSYIYPNGGKYDGEWVNDVPSGKGTLTTADGRTFAGEFKEGCMQALNEEAWASKTKKECGFSD